MCIILSNKINKIILERDNIELILQKKMKIVQDRKRTEIRKREKKEMKKKREEERIINKNKRKLEEKEVKKEIGKIIFEKYKSETDKIINKYYQLHKLDKEIKKGKRCSNIKTIYFNINDNEQKLDNYTKNENMKKEKENMMYDKFTEMIKKLICDDIINNHIYCKSSYNFGQKTLFMLYIRGNGFNEQNITNITNKYDLNFQIEKNMQKTIQTTIV